MVQYLALGIIKILKAQFLLIDENMLLAGKLHKCDFKGNYAGGSVGLESRTGDTQWRT